MTRLLFLILALSLTLLPASAQTELEASAEALRQAQYREALELCQKIEANGQASFGSLYNQGLALLHLGDRARARASFERALLLEPRSLATRRQLREVERLLGESSTRNDTRGTPWWRANEMELLLVLPGLCFMILAFVWRFKGRRASTKSLLVAVSSAILISAVALLSAPAEHRAIVVNISSALLSEPKNGGTGEKIPAGVMVDILEQQDHYIRVQLGDGRAGWLRQAQVAELTLPAEQPITAVGKSEGDSTTLTIPESPPGKSH